MPEMAPDKQREEVKTGEVAEAIYTEQQRGVLSTDLARLINFTVIVLSVLAQFIDVYDVVVFRPAAVIGEIEGATVPYLWTLVTCVLFERSFFFLGLHLLVLNYVVNQLEHVWTRTSFAALVIFSAFWTSVFRLIARVALA